MGSLAVNLEIVKSNIKASKKGFGVAKTLALSGKPGIGKTERMRSLAGSMDMGFYHQSMPEMDISVMSGLPEFYDYDSSKFHKNNIKAKGVAWSMPEIIMNSNIMAEKYKNGVILMLDDLHQTPISTMPYLYQLLNEKSLGNFMLADNVFIVAGLNDSDDANFDGIESPVMNRMTFLKTEFDANEFIDGYAKKFPFQIRSFIEHNPNYINEDESTTTAFGTPRSWNALSEFFGFMYTDNKKFLLDNVFSIASGNISEKASMEFEKHVSYIERLNLQKHVSNKDLFDISKKKTLDQVLLGYIPNFIKNVGDGSYLGELMSKNINNSNFIAFTMAEIYNKYEACMLNDDESLNGMTDGLKMIVAGITEDEDIIESLMGDDKDRNKIVKAFSLSDDVKDVCLELLSGFIEKKD